MPNLAVSAATMMSAHIAISKPPPSTWPWTAAISGLRTSDERPADAGDAAAEGDARPRAVVVAADVGAGAERALALGGQDRHPDLRVAVDLGPGLEQQRVHLRRHGVQRLRPVEPHVGDVAVSGELNVRHRRRSFQLGCSGSAGSSRRCGSGRSPPSSPPRATQRRRSTTAGDSVQQGVHLGDR